MARAFRLLKWLCFAGLLAAVGVPVFHFVRHRPRCTITGIGDVPHVSADGSRLVTLKPRGKKRVWMRGPLQVWNTHSGEADSEFFGDVGIEWLEASPDGHTLAASLTDWTVHLVDIRQRESRQVDGVERHAGMRFSPDGHWLWVHTPGKQRTCLIDVRACKAALRLAGRFERFSSDGRLAFVRNKTDLDVWDLETGDKIATLATGPGRLVSNDCALLVVRPASGKARLPGEPSGKIVDLWDLATFTRRWSWQHMVAGDLRAVFAPDGKMLALWLYEHSKDSEFAVLDTATGLPLWSNKVRCPRASGFSSNGALCFLWHSPQSHTLTMFDATTGAVVWEKPGRSVVPHFVGPNRIIHYARGDLPALIEGSTGKMIARLPLNSFRDDADPDFDDTWLADLTMTADNRHFAYGGWKKQETPGVWGQWLDKVRLRLFGGDPHSDDARVVAVMECETGRQLCRINGAGSRRHLLSDDVSTLVTVDGESSDNLLIRVWDVSAAKAWLWSLTVAAAVGCVILVLRWAWRRARPNIVARPSEA